VAASEKTLLFFPFGADAPAVLAWAGKPVAFVPDQAIEQMNDLTGRAFKLYAYYCKRADEHGECYPSLALTAHDCGWQKSHASEARKELITKGWICFDGQVISCQVGFTGRSQNGNSVPKTGTPTVPKTGTIIPETGTENSQNGNKSFPKRESHIGRTSPINQPIEPAQLTSPGTLPEKPSGDSSESRSDGSSVEPKITEQVKEVFTYWQNTLGHPTAKLTDERKRKIEARLREKYTVEQIKQAIDGCAASPFHRGENDKGQVFDDVELICRTGSKLEGFIGRRNGHAGKVNGKAPPLSKSEQIQQHNLALLARRHGNQTGNFIEGEIVND